MKKVKVLLFDASLAFEWVKMLAQEDLVITFITPPLLGSSLPSGGGSTRGERRTLGTASLWGEY